MKKKIFNIALCLSLGTVCNALAAPTVVPVSSQEDLTITIYNQGRALVKDIRTVDLKTGLNQISFEDISDQVMPSSVLFKATGASVQEQNFNFDLLTHDNMLKKSVGQVVNVEFINPATGAVLNQKAEVLSYNNHAPVLKINGKIETNYPGRIIFNEVPKNLAAKPSLVFDVNASMAGIKKAEVSYLTTGLSWEADYVAEITPAEELTLNGLVTLTNNTQVSYYNARLQLVAGDVNIVHPRMEMYGKPIAAAVRMNAMDAAMEPESVSGYYLYTLKRPTDILSNQTKQVSLLSGQNIQSKKTYEFSSLLNYYSESTFENEKPTMYLSFVNSTQNHLGEPLPKGTVRVYQKDSSGRLIFVGEDRINHTAKNRVVRLTLGEDFDITATGKRVSFKKIDSKNSQAEFELKIANAKTEPVVVRYKQYLPNGWRILSESLKSQKENSNQIYWDIAVGAESEVVLNFKIAVDSQ